MNLSVCGDAASSKYQVKYWLNHFKWGRESIEDDCCPGRPVEVTTLEMCQKIEDLVMQDRYLKVSIVTQECSVLEPSVLIILYDHLGMLRSVFAGF
jgi:hypothetical protein